MRFEDLEISTMLVDLIRSKDINVCKNVHFLISDNLRPK